MQVSSFSENRVRKAGSLEESSGRELNFKNPLSKLDIERQETDYDDVASKIKNRLNKKRQSRAVNRGLTSSVEDNNLSGDEDIKLEESNNVQRSSSSLARSKPKNFLASIDENKPKYSLEPYNSSDIKIKNRNSNKNELENIEAGNSTTIPATKNNNKLTRSKSEAESKKQIDENSPFMVKSVIITPRKQTLVYEDEDFEEIKELKEITEGKSKKEKESAAPTNPLIRNPTALPKEKKKKRKKVISLKKKKRFKQRKKKKKRKYRKMILH